LIDLELKTINVPTRWDGKWRLILFDIPEAKRVLRDQTRRLIKELHCIQLQQSVWVHPFPCFSQFRQIQKAYGRSNDIILIETDTIEGATHLIKIFGKIYSRTKF
jgi:phenylacetic acid degradation operon negative regulatory protein